ncbi:histidine kinase [Nocardia sp. NBC_00565]|uniref:sensor histidine kinase n=1 Tax=Nocardia sp. NBC_00565 TaxID=2975993 RepID=UPI002E818AA0|nr:histidine kinase [Nocardia sp. NBC_00565]WUC01565.1 histidine kinase [Nocardia sp. NBC_00565]
MTAPGESKRGPVVQDWVLAFVVGVIQVAGGRGANLSQTGVHSLDVFGYVLLLVGPMALPLRRPYPLPVLLVTITSCAVYLLRGYGYGPIFVSLVIAFLTAAIVGSRWWTYPLAPIGYLALVWPLPTMIGHPADPRLAFGMIAWLGVLVAIAEGIRQRKAALVARRQRAEAARRDEEAQRERRASEERLAIARELHDVLAHSLSLINVQSSVALELFDKKPEQAESALAAIKSASKDALAEVHTLLHAIRSGSPTPVAPDEPAVDAERTPESTTDRRDSERTQDNSVVAEAPPRPAAPRSPAPSIEDLDALLQRARAAGLTVDTRVIGTAHKLPSVVDVAAARIIQESLTNVVRHAPGAPAAVTVRYAADSVEITIDNARSPGTQSKSGPGGGNGILGMRERAHALGGQLIAGPRPSGGFRVVARLPSQVGAQEEAR